MNKFFTVIIAGFILYKLLVGRIDTEVKDVANHSVNYSAKSQNKTHEADMEGNFIEKSVSKIVVNALKTEEGRQIFSNIIKPMNKNEFLGSSTIKFNSNDMLDNLFSIKTLNSVQNKVSACCGQKVTVDYTIIDDKGAVLKEEKKKSRLGSNELGQSLENVIMGMKIGETREAVTARAYLSPEVLSKFNTEGLSYKLIVTLTNIEKDSIDPTNIRIWDSETAYLRPYLCGDKVEFDIKITNMRGELVHDSQRLGKKLSTRLGDLNNPIITSIVIPGKVPVGIRTVIAKGSLLYNIDGGLIEEFKPIINGFTNQQELLIIDFFNFSTF